MTAFLVEHLRKPYGQLIAPASLVCLLLLLLSAISSFGLESAEDTRAQLAVQWALFSYGRFVELTKTAEAGVSLIEFRYVSKYNDVKAPAWTEQTGYRPLEATELIPPYLSGFAIRARARS